MIVADDGDAVTVSGTESADGGFVGRVVGGGGGDGAACGVDD